MHPYWFWLGPLPIRAYSTIFVAAFLLGLVVAIYVMRAEGLGRYVNHVLDLSFWWFVAGIIGARFWQVFFFDWGFYRQNPLEIPAIWHGGLSIQGGIVGALIASILYMRKHQMPFWALADAIAPGMILGQSVGRDANLMNGDAFGSPNPGGFGLVYPPDSLAAHTYGSGTPLWPAEVWEGQLDIIIFALLLILLLRFRRRVQGTIFLAYMALYNAARFFLEMLRGDSPRDPYLHWDAAQWTSLAVVLICAVVWVVLRWREQHAATSAVAVEPAAADDEAAPAPAEPPAE